MLNRLLASLSLAFVLTLGAAPAFAFSDVFVFGDSLSDAGAFGHLLGGVACPAAPYDGCRFSNGPTWAENLATSLGNSADTAYAPGGGTNYAIGGERSDELFASGTAINGGQIPDFSSDVGGIADPNALYIIWAGGNNFLQDDPPGTFDPSASAADIVQAVTDLSVLGAENFLVANLPINDPWAFSFNTALSSGLSTLSTTDPTLDILEFDTLSVLLGATLNPAAFGLTNVLDPCVDAGAGTVCANPNEYLLWDTVHPTARGHEILSDAALAIVPEPGTATLLGLGLVMIAGRRRQAR